MNGVILALLLTATPLTLEQYVGALKHIDALLAANQVSAAETEAWALMHRDVTWKEGTFRTDDALLAAITRAGRGDGSHRARLLFAIDELRRTAGMTAGRADPNLLARIAAEQAVPELPKGGTIDTSVNTDVPLLERIAQAIADAWEWLSEKLGKLLDWLFDLLPRTRGGGRSATPGMRGIVMLLVLIIVVVIVVLAIGVLRRSRAAAPEAAQTSEPLGSRRDEDPLSRGAAEWERYAATLAGAGRFREAIRAWYHAVLVTCYAAGILHFRKGRTNWEYISSLAPALAWRAELIALTRRFEREWYGADESTAEAHEHCRELALRIAGAIQRELRGAA